jgi:hypothetical protein
MHFPVAVEHEADLHTALALCVDAGEGQFWEKKNCNAPVTFCHQYRHLVILGSAKMAEDGVSRDIEEALNEIVNTTDQNGNMRKELKKTIYEMVSTLRNLFVTLKVQLEEGKSEKVRLERELKDTRTTLDEGEKVSDNAVTKRRAGAAATQAFTRTKLQTIFRCSGWARRKEIHVNTQDKR